MGNSEESSNFSWVADAWTPSTSSTGSAPPRPEEQQPDNGAQGLSLRRRLLLRALLSSRAITIGSPTAGPARTVASRDARASTWTIAIGTMFYCEWGGERCPVARAALTLPEGERGSGRDAPAARSTCPRHPLLGDGDNATPSPTASSFPSASPSPSGTPVASPPLTVKRSLLRHRTPMASGTPVPDPPYDGTERLWPAGLPLLSPPYDGGNDPCGTRNAYGQRDSRRESPPYYGTGTPMASRSLSAGLCARLNSSNHLRRRKRSLLRHCGPDADERQRARPVRQPRARPVRRQPRAGPVRRPFGPIDSLRSPASATAVPASTTA